MARSVCLMANPKTSKRMRELESANMRSKIVRAANNRRRKEQEKTELKNLRAQQTSVAATSMNNSTTGGNPDNQGAFILVTLPIFSTGVDEEAPIIIENPNSANVPSLLRMSQALPHIDIPIGLQLNTKLSIRAVFDSGAGLNVGRRGYHEALKKSYSDTVAHYVDLEKGNYDTPGIGGVDGNAYGSAVTALITYRTPFYVGGQPVKLTFGLVEGLCAKSIIGIATMQKAKMNYLVHSQIVTSETFNFTFQVTLQKPSVEDVPPIPIEGNSAVLQTRFKSA